MKCEACASNLNARGAVLVIVKLPARLNRKNELILPQPQKVSVTGLDEEDVECAQCGALLRDVRTAEHFNAEHS